MAHVWGAVGPEHLLMMAGSPLYCRITKEVQRSRFVDDVLQSGHAEMSGQKKAAGQTSWQQRGSRARSMGSST